MTLHNHILTLTERHKISVSETQGCLGCADSKARAISLAEWPIKSVVGYGIALHEIGHLVSEQKPLTPGDSLAQMGFGKEFVSDVCLTNEIAAWRWARRIAIKWDETMEKKAQFSLMSYAIPARWAARVDVEVRFSGTIVL